jgi:long-chain acyl-CoA synthetase
MTRDEAIAILTGPGQQFEVVEETVLGVRMRVFKNAPPSMRKVLEASRAFGDRDFLVYGDERWTFAEHFSIAAGLANRLLEHHQLVKGQRVGIAMRNYPEWVMAFWAIQAAGLVAVPLNAWWTGPELDYAIRDSELRLVIADGERLALMRPTLVGLGVHAIVVRSRSEPAGSEERWDDIIAGLDRSAAMPDVAIDPDDDATILYTSGTTGSPKGAVATNRNHAHNLMNTALSGAVASAMTGPGSAFADPAALAPAGLQTFPFFHIAGLTVLYVSTAVGSRLVLIYKWDPEVAIGLIEREKITTFSGVPTVVRSLLETAERQDRALSSLSFMGSGGAPVPPDLIGRIDRDFSSKVSPGNGYGLTETTSAVVTTGGPAYVAKPSSVGRPVVVADLRIVVPDTDRDVSTGEIGEIWVKGPNVVRGYWNNPEATTTAFTEGWFHTGDLGYLDHDGYLYVVDRMKDVIIRGGENIYCAEVEAVLFEHPAVTDAAVIGVPHRSLGEEVAAVVVSRDGVGVTASELRQFVASRLATYKVPAHIVFRDHPLPRTPTGKVLKRDLRDQALTLVNYRHMP